MNRKSMIRPFFYLLLCVGSLTGCGTILDTGDELTTARDLMEKKEYNAAIEILRPYIYKNHDSSKANLLIGQAILNQNVNEEENQYLARYYFSSARDVAASEGERLAADQAYADVKLIMGKTEESADTLFDAAQRSDTIGNDEQAAKLFLHAAHLYVLDEEYSDAIKSCQSGLKSNPDVESRLDLSLIQARAMFLNRDYSDSIDLCMGIDNLNCELPPAYVSEKGFILSASKVLIMETKRDWMSFNPFKKEFKNGNEHAFEENFKRSLNYLEELNSSLKVEKTPLIGKYYLILARHANENDMETLSKQAYQFSRSVFNRAGLEEEALEVGEELAEVSG